jgi:MoxR-like ATPase
MSALDHRCQVTLDGRGGELVEGNPMNLIVFSTMNEGDGYVVNQVDNAQKRRLGNTFYTDYLGMDDVEKEAELITERTPISYDHAEILVDCANEIRQKAQGGSAVNMGIPTSSMLDWARTAWSYKGTAPAAGPYVKAGIRTVMNPYYRGDSTEEDTVETTIESHLKDLRIEEDDVDDEDLEEVADTSSSDPDSEPEGTEVSEDTWLMCETCGWYGETEEVEDEVISKMKCPDCDETLIPKDGV